MILAGQILFKGDPVTAGSRGAQFRQIRSFHLIAVPDVSHQSKAKVIPDLLAVRCDKDLFGFPYQLFKSTRGSASLEDLLPATQNAIFVKRLTQPIDAYEGRPDTGQFFQPALSTEAEAVRWDDQELAAILPACLTGDPARSPGFHLCLGHAQDAIVYRKHGQRPRRPIRGGAQSADQ